VLRFFSTANLQAQDKISLVYNIKNVQKDMILSQAEKSRKQNCWICIKRQGKCNR